MEEKLFFLTQWQIGALSEQSFFRKLNVVHMCEIVRVGIVPDQADHNGGELDCRNDDQELL